MGADGGGEPVDPIRTFTDRLRGLQVDSGGPSVRDLVRLTERVGTPYTRGTIQDKLAGRSVASWEFVEAFVLACAMHTGSATAPDLRQWRRWHAEMTRELAASRTGRRQVVKADVSPYRGLEAFTVEHAEWFHGRTGAVDRVVAGLDAHRAGILVLGPSGAGKSSVVQAGVLPALAGGALPGSDRWITVPARPGKDLRAELDRAGLPGAGNQPVGAVVAHRLAGEPAGTRVLLMIDQFEELLTPAAGGDQAAAQQEIIDGLTAAVGEPGLSVILVLRDDFYPRLASQAPALLQALTPGLVNLPATLDTQELRDIITLPAEAVGLGLQDGLPERIITDVLAVDPTVGATRQAPVTVLPLLELTLEQLWQRRHGGLLTHDAYHRAGGIAGALTTWCDSAIEQLPGEHRTIAQRILTALVRPADDEHHIPAVRQQVPLAVLRRLADPTTPSGDQPSPSVDEVVVGLTDHRIVTTRNARTSGQHPDTPGVPVAELVHEALIRDWAALRDWVSQDHRFQDWLRRAAERHSRWVSRRDPGDLLRGGDLAEGVEWSARRRLPDQVTDLLVASRHFQRTGVRRTRIVAAVLAALLVAALAATGVAVRQRQTAVAAQRVAQSRQLAAQSTALLSANSDLASLLAVRAYRTSPTAEATAAVNSAAASPLLRRLETDTQWSLAFSGDRHTLATGGYDGAIRLWDVPEGTLRTELRGHTGPVRRMAFSSDNRTLASAGDDRTVRVWDITGARRPATLRGHTDAVTSVLFSPDGNTLASGGQDHTVRLWDVTSRQPRATLPGYVAAFSSIAISPAGQTIATGSDQGRIRLWNPRSGRLLRVLPGHSGTVNAVAFSPDGRTLASAGTDRTIRFWTMPGGQPREGTIHAHTDEARAVAFSPDGRILATGSNDHTARLWDFAGLRPRTTLTGHSDDVNEFVFSQDGHALLTAGNDGVPRLWNVADGRLRATFSGGGTNMMAFSPDGRSIATAGNSGARLWDAAVGLSRWELTDGIDHTWLAAFAPDGRSLATAGGGGTIRLWETSTRRRTGTLETGSNDVLSIAFSPDGRLMASASTAAAPRGGQVHLWDLARRATPTVFSDGGNTVAFSPDGRTLVSGYDTGTIQLRDVADPSRTRTLEGHTAAIINLAFGPDRRTLASTSQDRTVRLWDLATGRERLVLRGHTNDVEAVAISPDGRTVASGSWDGARLWDAATGHLRTTLTGHAQRVIAVSFSPDGSTLATASADNTVRLWDLAAGHTRKVIGGYVDAVTTVAFSPDGQLLATAGWRGSVQVWDIALPTISTAVDQICRTVNRDLSPQERSTYLPGASTTPVCP